MAAPSQRMPLARALRLLERHHGVSPAAPRDAWHTILRENVVYLAADDVRDRALDALRRITGLRAERIASCPDELLLQACAHGRMAAQRVVKLRECAALFATVGDPRELALLPRAAARKALRKFPGIGEPGVDLLRLFADAEPVLALDSNALRVLLRLGYGEPAKAYATSYRSAQRAAMAELPADPAELRAAHVLLRRHGQTLCRNTLPQCDACPLHPGCPSAS